MTTVRVRNATKTFGRTTALDDVTLDAGPGVTGLLGPNGAGKTTLLRVIATVLAPDRGAVTLMGRDPARPSDRTRIRERLGYLPQDAGFHRGFTVFEFIDYVAILKEMTDRRPRHDEVRRVIALTGLAAVSAKRIRALSGGMRRRVGLAQALLGDPDLLVLDEPTVGLDPEQRLRFREMISQAGEGRTVVMSSHQTEDITALCATIAVIHQGRARFTGTPAELTARADGRVWTDERRSPAAITAWRTGDGTYRNVGDPPARAELIPPTLEDAYLLLMGEPGREVTHS
ncbi:ATP-binding cassette domain-containing protein [Actinoplanes sp. NPDC051470]|uniref:ATP-binding cassette domain-containing protein n=1 Tax=Actinoplanes sp. NPDC051470 TaxID=3157224 RepID=UPI0034318E40